MSHEIQKRDRQTGLEVAWHRKTHVVEEVNRDNSMPWDVSKRQLLYESPYGQIQEAGDHSILIADDDGLVVGGPFASTYHPSSVKTFWNVIEKGLEGIDYQIVSSGSVSDRTKIFTSIKLNEGFNIAGREFKDYLTLIDSFDKSTSFQCRYSNVCVVCANTYSAVMNSGETVGKARHTVNIDIHIEALIKCIKEFTNFSNKQKEVHLEAHNAPISRDEARAWFASIEGRNSKVITNPMMQKIARLTELFESGKGNEGKTRLDAFQAFTEFHTHESSNRSSGDSQYMTSEWGSSAQLKNTVIKSLNSSFRSNVTKGDSLLLEKATA
jgi:hypothetical protein